MLRSGTAHAIGITLTTLNLIYIYCVHAFLSSHLYYCNALLFGLANGQLDRLLKVQNAAARVIFQIAKLDHITLTLIDLHYHYQYITSNVQS